MGEPPRRALSPKEIEKVAAEVLAFYFQHARGSTVSVRVSRYLNKRKPASFRRCVRLPIKKIKDTIVKKFKHVEFNGKIYVLDAVVTTERGVILRFKKVPRTCKPKRSLSAVYQHSIGR